VKLDEPLRAIHLLNLLAYSVDDVVYEQVCLLNIVGNCGVETTTHGQLALSVEHILRVYDWDLG
jgi:hypothetical protein